VLDADLYDETDAKSTEIADGKYQARIEDFEINESQSGRVQAVFKIQLVSGEAKGRTLYKRDGLDSEESVGWFKSGIKRLGLEPPTSEELNDGTFEEEVVGSFVEVTCKTKDPQFGPNVYFNRAIEEDDIEAEELEDDDYTPSKGDKVMATYEDGEKYAGTVKSVSKKNETAKIEWEDGSDPTDVPWDEIEPAEDEEDEEEEDEDEDEGEEEEEGEEEDDGDEEENEEGITIDFDDDDLKASQKKAIKSLAKANEFSADDYETTSDMLADIAEYLGVTGEFDSPAKLLKKAEAASEAEDEE
jgi:hypothetical protein